MSAPLQRVVIDARTVVPRASGIGNYVRSLIEHVVPMAEDLHFTLLKHPRAEGSLFAPGRFEQHRVTEVVVPGETKSLQTLAMRLWHSFDGASLYHSPADIVPIGIGRPYVVTLHDLMWIEQPHLASAFAPSRVALGAFYGVNIARSVRGARRIIAISKATADAIGRVFPDHAHKVSVVHHGLDPARYAPDRVPARTTVDRLVPPGLTYSLIVGQGSPYKNHAGMVRAFAEAMRDRPDHKLVLVRRFSRVDREMSRLLARPEVAQKIIHLPFVADADLLALMGHARMLLFVSHVEGFGLPPLESFAIGTPVLASTAAAVSEVTGDAALHAEPTNHRDMVDKMRRLDDDDALRQRLIERGRARARVFSWERCARETLAVYRAAMGAGRRWSRADNPDNDRPA